MVNGDCFGQDMRSVVPECAQNEECDFLIMYKPKSDKRDLLAIKVKSEIFTEKGRPSCCEQLQKN